MRLVYQVAFNFRTLYFSGEDPKILQYTHFVIRTFRVVLSTD
jgi:hypothetical protein